MLVDKLGRNLGELADVDNRSCTVFIEGGGGEETATVARDHYSARCSRRGNIANHHNFPPVEERNFRAISQLIGRI